MKDDLLTISEAAAVAGISKQAVADAVHRRTLPSVTVKVPALRIRRSDLAKHIKRSKRRPGRPRLS